ncbi:AAA family ATPase [Candidatus Latescibacterota bacterium]
MNELEFLKIIIPPATISGNGTQGTVTYKIEKDEDMWYLAGKLRSAEGEVTDRLLLEPEDIIDVLDGTLDVDQYCQDEQFRQHQEELAQRLGNKLSQDQNRNTVSVTLGPYMRQQHVTRGTKHNFLQILMESTQNNTSSADIPEHLRVNSPEGFIPDERVLSGTLQRIHEGQPATAILGPTGSGKSALARFIGANLNNQGYGIHIIDANSRLEGDRLFDRDDFNAEGTFILEGVLCTLAREAKKLGIKLVVVLEEYNAFSDETRREFYRLFADHDRYYPIQSSKDNKVVDKVDFSHVQFLITANPLSSDKYLTDDLKRLSNAEARRMVILYQDYARDDQTIKQILQSLVRKKTGYAILTQKSPDFEKAINWQLGIDVFKELNRRSEEEDLGWDIGYTAIADMLWTAVIRSHEQENFVTAMTEHILNGIPDISTRMLAADRIRQAVGVDISTELITRDG